MHLRAVARNRISDDVVRTVVLSGQFGVFQNVGGVGTMLAAPLTIAITLSSAVK